MKFKNLLLVLFLGFVCFIGIQDVNAATVDDLVNKLKGGNFAEVYYDTATSQFRMQYKNIGYLFDYDSVANTLTGKFNYHSDETMNDTYYVLETVSSTWFDIVVPSNITYHYETEWVIGTADSPLCKFDQSGVCLGNDGSALEYKLELSDKLSIFVTNGYGNTGDDTSFGNDGENEGTGTDNPYTGSEDIIICSILLLVVGTFLFTIMKKNGKIAKI